MSGIDFQGIEGSTMKAFAGNLFKNRTKYSRERSGWTQTDHMASF